MKLDVRTCPLDVLEHVTIYLDDKPVDYVIEADEELGYVIYHRVDRDGNPVIDENYRDKNGQPVSVKGCKFGAVRIVFDPGFEPKGLMVENELVDMSRLKALLDSGEHPPIGRKK